MATTDFTPHRQKLLALWAKLRGITPQMPSASGIAAWAKPCVRPLRLGRARPARVPSLCGSSRRRNNADRFRVLLFQPKST